MLNKVAILIDGDFFLKRFQENHKKNPRHTDVDVFIKDTLKKVQALTGGISTDVLFRTFYYTCRPFGETREDPNGNKINFGTTPQYIATTAFLKDLSTSPQMALRLGELSFNPWKVELDANNMPVKNADGTFKYKADFKQKSVDMKIGLDIAWLASKKIVDKIVLVAGDSDFISPMKFARREGLLVYLCTMQQKNIKIELKEHADFIIE
jgi:uncharacterized LabA/DUF88 family protein